MVQVGFHTLDLKEVFVLGIELEKTHQILLYLKYNL